MNSTSFSSIPSICTNDDKMNSADDCSSTTPLTLNFPSTPTCGNGETGNRTTVVTNPSGQPTAPTMAATTADTKQQQMGKNNNNNNNRVGSTSVSVTNLSGGNGSLPTVKLVSSSGQASLAANKVIGSKYKVNHSSAVSKPVQLFESLSRSKQTDTKKRPTAFEYRLLVVGVVVLAVFSIFLSFVSLLMLPNYIRTNYDKQCNDNRELVISRKEAESSYCLTPDCVKVAASVMEAIDFSVNPCDNFYLYSCGSWIKSNPLPDGKPNWGNFGKLWQDNLSTMRNLLENTEFKNGSAEQKAKTYYESCLDKNETIEAKGPKPVQELIESTGGWNVSGKFDVDTWDLQSALQMYHNKYNRGGLFTWLVGADERNSSRSIIQLDQGSALGLPSRDFYLNKTDKNILDAYLPYMIKIGQLMGGTDVSEQMKDVLEFEKKIAAITVPADQRRNEESIYHKFTLKEFTKRASFLNWTKYFDDAFDYHSRTSISESSAIKPATNGRGARDVHQISRKNETTTASLNSKTSNDTNSGLKISSTITKHTITEDEHVVVYAPEYFDDMTALAEDYMKTKRGKTTLANYLGWSVIQSLIATLPKNFRDASKLLRKAMFGSESMEMSWKYCISDTNGVMGFALGSLFVKQVFDGESRERVEEMINSIREAFQDNLDKLDWMDDRTRYLAREKADYIRQMIGFPDFIMDSDKLNSKYEGLELDPNDYFLNNIKVNVLMLRENMEKLFRPPNRTDWEMTPPTVNAYYTPTKNQIVLPAGILQTPFYDLKFPNSLNYGAMGVVLGHELTHAFDDQGREYDKDGNLHKWWNNDTLKSFEDRVKCLVDQYSEYKIEDNHLNGKQTLGENIADNGGLKSAFRAYEKWSRKHPSPQLPGLNLTDNQLFFVGFAQVWCSTSTPEALRLQVLNDAHAPAPLRVLGTLSNSNEFAIEFNCPLNSNMNPKKKCVVW